MYLSERMNYLIVLIIVSNLFIVVNCGECTLLNDSNVDELWDKYKVKYNKTYTGFIDKRRKKVWLQNCEKIKNHNKEAEDGKHSYTIFSNHLGDLTARHYLTKMVKLIHSPRRDISRPEEVAISHSDLENIPVEVDWRKQGFVTPPNNQKECGSCYAFSISHSIQAQLFKNTKILEPLSEQQIVDCSLLSGNHGCGGGSLRNTLKYIENAGGLMSARDYPYLARQSLCKFNKNKVMVNVSSWSILPPRDEKHMQAVVAKVGPVPVSINASPQTFQLYKSGVYDDPSCTDNVVNHAMLVVGYTPDAWILKNWWGPTWGENGYMRVKRNINQCGISNYVAYIKV